jgi:hypothetical protein
MAEVHATSIFRIEVYVVWLRGSIPGRGKKFFSTPVVELYLHSPYVFMA